MAYNGFWADFLFNTGVVAAWCVFLWRVLDGPRFSWWGTALLDICITIKSGPLTNFDIQGKKYRRNSCIFAVSILHLFFQS